MACALAGAWEGTWESRWGSDGFQKLSSDEKSCEEAPRAELTVCPLWALTSGLCGNPSLTNPQEAFKPWWGLWAPGHEPLPSAVSLFPSMS